MILLETNDAILDHLQKQLDKKPNTPRKKSLASAIDKVKLIFKGQKQKFTDIQIEELDNALHNTTALLAEIVQIKPTIEPFKVEYTEHNFSKLPTLPNDEYRKAMASETTVEPIVENQEINPHILNEKLSAIRLKLIQLSTHEDTWANTFANDLLQNIVKYGNKTMISNKQLAIIEKLSTPKQDNDGDSIENVKSLIKKIQEKYVSPSDRETHKFILDICDQFSSRINQYGDKTIISVKQLDLLKKYAKDTTQTTKKTGDKEKSRKLPNHTITETQLSNLSARKIKLELFKNYESLRKDKNFMLREKDIIIPFVELYETTSNGLLPLAIPDIDFDKFNSDQIQFIKKLYAIIIINIISYGESSLDTFFYAENAYKILEDIYSKVNDDVIKINDKSRAIYKDILSIWDKPTFLHHRYYKCAMFY